MNQKILAIIPAYNEQTNLHKVISDLRAQAPFADIIVINDRSTDNTEGVCKELNVPVVSTVYNLGIGGAVQTGFKYARGHGYDIAIQVDGDGQHPAREIPRLIAPLVDGSADVVIGTRFIKKEGYQSTFTRFLGITLFSFITSLIIRQRVTDVTSGFRAINKRVISFCADEYPEDFPDAETIILLAFTGFRLKEIPVTMLPRLSGKSSTDMKKTFIYIFKTSLSILAVLLQRTPEREE